MTSLPSTARPARLAQSAAGALPGVVLGAAALAAAVVRRTKPLHPVGRVGHGILTIDVPAPEWQVPLLAATGERHCLVRASKAMGMPEGVADIDGLALRFQAEGAEPEESEGDILLAATGTSALGRYVLRLRQPRHHGPLTTLLPVRTRHGALLVQVRPVGLAADPPSQYAVSVAGATSEWTRVGTLSVVWEREDMMLRFDPLRHVLQGTEQYPLVRTVREPAYAAARTGAPHP